jgi:hypothetical protein
MELTSREKDVITLARHWLFELGDHPGESFILSPEVVPEVLGTILMLAKRIGAGPGWGPSVLGCSGPREFAEEVRRKAIQEERAVQEMISG